MSKLGEFVAFRAMILLKENGLDYLYEEAGPASVSLETGNAYEKRTVQKFYGQFPLMDEEISVRFVEIIRPKASTPKPLSIKPPKPAQSLSE
jgi:hypothetical protein